MAARRKGRLDRDLIVTLEHPPIFTLNQYLQPTPANLPVAHYVPPEAFRQWRRIALDLGFDHVAAAPFVRSSIG